MTYHDAHDPYISAVDTALNAAGIETLDWYADPNDPRDGAIRITPVGNWASHDQIWLGWQEERGWNILTIDERPGGRDSSRFVYDLDVATVASPETVVNAVIAMGGLDGSAPSDNYPDEDFPDHAFDIDNPKLEAALAAYGEAGK